MAKRVHVAVGVVMDNQGRILIAKRPDHVHQGGLWEFPGGKVEQGETLIQALDRELFEELDIRVDGALPLIDIIHDYPDKQVHLAVCRVVSWHGMPVGKEGQPTRWVEPHELDQYPFPAANYPILNALQLPERCLITGEFATPADLTRRLRAALSTGLRMVLLRAHDVSVGEYVCLAQEAIQHTKAKGVKLLLAHPHILDVVREVNADGVHLSSSQLMSLGADVKTNIPDDWMIGASCHSPAELRQAELIRASYVFLSPVKATASHPGKPPMGWVKFAELARRAQVPVYALGGLADCDVAQAIEHGGQGIAAIRAWW
ncbi:Nudix family hydrolase [Gilvimarinus sp. SDUM040013]|nr:Nudix family hydrolase [Gilvimarinus sp. SDUM040013]MDO3388381.1 Nudix family hydrolase [Gilvimarinus sp. SDUM040013]